MTPADLQQLISTANGAAIDGGGQQVTFVSSFPFSTSAKFKNFKFNFPFNGLGMTPAGLAWPSLSPNSGLPKGFVQIAFNAPCSLVADDLLFIKSSDIWGTTEIMSQWGQVGSVSPDGLVVTLKAPLAYTFLTNIQVIKVQQIDVQFEDCAFTGMGAQNTQKLLRPQNCTMRLNRCTFDQTGHSGVEFYRCFDIGGSGNSFKHAKGVDAYGMVFDGGCEFIHFMDTSGDDLGHLWTFGGTSGINRNAVMIGNIMYNARKALVDTHTSADLIACLGLIGTHTQGAVSEAVMMQGARCFVAGVQILNAAGGMISQPMTRLYDDWCEFEGRLGDMLRAGAAPAFLIDNRKPAGSMALFKVSGSAQAARGLIVKNTAMTDIKKVHADLDITADTVAAQIIQTGAGKIGNVDLHGSYTSLSAAVENIIVDAAVTGGIDGVKVHGRVLGGQIGVRNIGSATNVRVADGQTITGQSSAKTMGPVSVAVT